MGRVVIRRKEAACAPATGTARATVTTPEDLSREQLLDIVKSVQGALYGNHVRDAAGCQIDYLDRSKEWDSTTLENVAYSFDVHGLVPKECPFCGTTDDGCDCRERIECGEVGSPTHLDCGICPECALPRFQCNHNRY